MGTYKGTNSQAENLKDTKKSPIKSLGATSNFHQQSVMEEGVELNEEIPIDDPNYVAKHKEMFWECNSESRGVFFKEDLVDFGYTPSGQKSDPKEVTIVNNLNYDVKAFWIIPSLPAGSSKVYFFNKGK